MLHHSTLASSERAKGKQAYRLLCRAQRILGVVVWDDSHIIGPIDSLDFKSHGNCAAGRVERGFLIQLLRENSSFLALMS